MGILHREVVGQMGAPHRHEDVELNLVIAGTATYLLDGRRYELRPQTLVWLFPRQEHILTNHSWDYQDWLGLFDRGAVRSICTTPETQELLLPDPSGHFARRLSADAAATLESLLEHIARAANADTADTGLRFALLAAWEAFRATSEMSPVSSVHPAVLRAARLLRADAGAETVHAIARVVSLSPHHLSRLFLDQMGVSIPRFRNEQRFRRLLDVYGAGDRMSILDAAITAGFGSYAQFYRVFCQLTGSNPSSYLHRRS